MKKKFISLFLLISTYSSNAMNSDAYTKEINFYHKSTLKRAVKTYLQEHELVTQARQVKKEAVLKVLSSLDFLNNKEDVKTFEYALWYYPKQCAAILNTNQVDFHLADLCKKLEEEPPSITIKNCHKVTPFGFGATERNTFYYGILKFIGQYTQSRDQFDMCLATVYNLIDKITHYVMLPNTLLYLMHQNEHFYDRNFPRPHYTLIHKKNDFNCSVGLPTENKEREHRIITYRFAQSLFQLFHYDSAKILFIKKFSDCHYTAPTNINNFFNDSIWIESVLGNNTLPVTEDIKDLAVVIMNKITKPTEDEIQELADHAAHKIITGLHEEDSYELEDIIGSAIVLFKDNHKKEYGVNDLAKKLAFMKLLTNGIVPINSEVAYYAIRTAAHYGRCWAIKFLVDCGVTINPPAKIGVRRVIPWVPTEEEMSPLEIAKKYNHVHVFNVLQ